VIKTMPGGGKWYCEQCDVTHDGRTLVMNWTAGAAPAKCSHCEEPSCFFILGAGGKVEFVSVVMPKREAADLQRRMQEGGVCTAERGAELRKRKEEGR